MLTGRVITDSAVISTMHSKEGNGPKATNARAKVAVVANAVTNRGVTTMK